VPENVRHHGVGRRLRSSSTFVLLGLNLLIYLLLTLWVSENIHTERLVDYFRQVPVWALLGSLLINLLLLVMYGVRMALLAGRDFRAAFSIINIGYALNALLPLRLGEAIKLYLSHRLFRIPMTGIFAASVAEKLIDLVMILLLGTTALVFAAGEFIQASALLSICVLVSISIAVILIFRSHVVNVIRLFPRGSRLRRISIELHKHASEYPVSRLLLVTIGIWFLNISLVFFSFNTYLPEFRIGLLEAVELLVVMALAIAIPSAPAGIGLFEAGIVAYLTQKSSVGNEAALAVASVFHITIIFPQLVVTGLLLWIRSGIALKVKAEDSLNR
jgi:hypothetical protein